MAISEEDKKVLLESIRDIPDFPKEGILFKDITTLLSNAEAFGVLMKHLHSRYNEYNLDFIAGIDARGFIFGAALAQMLNIGFVPIRKKGKLPYTTISETYDLEYGTDEIEVHVDAFANKKGARVLLIDDLMATGGTATAAASLIKKVEAQCVEACFIMNLNFEDAQEKLGAHTKIYTVLENL